MTDNRAVTGRINGRFAPGQSGNPGGRPRSLDVLKERFTEMLPSAIDELEKIIHDPKVRAGDRISAIRLVTEYTAGKAPVGVNLSVQQVPQDPDELNSKIEYLLAKRAEDD